MKTFKMLAALLKATRNPFLYTVRVLAYHKTFNLRRVIETEHAAMLAVMRKDF